MHATQWYINSKPMRHYLFILLIAMTSKVYSQNHAYYVKQTQISMDMESWKALQANLLFVEIVFKEKGIEFNMLNGKYTFIEWSKINKVGLEQNSYRYELSISDMDVGLFFIQQSYENSTAKLAFAIVNIPGLKKEDPNIITFFRLVFIDGLMIND